jgi:hypothetical protein
MKEKQHDGRYRQHRGDGKADAPKAHEIEFCIVGNNAKEAHGKLSDEAFFFEHEAFREGNRCAGDIHMGTTRGRHIRTQ